MQENRKVTTFYDSIAGRYLDKLRDWCRRCAVCSASNEPQWWVRTLMKQYNQRWTSTDSPFPDPDLGNKNILVAINYFSKSIEAYVLSNQESTTMTNIPVKDMHMPLSSYTIQDKHLKSALFWRVGKIWRKKKGNRSPSGK